jgi:hypothetical protein
MFNEPVHSFIPVVYCTIHRKSSPLHYFVRVLRVTTALFILVRDIHRLCILRNSYGRKKFIANYNLCLVHIGVNPLHAGRKDLTVLNSKLAEAVKTCLTKRIKNCA